MWPDWAIYRSLVKFLKPLATNNCPKSLSKSILFLVKSLLGNFYRHLAIFILSHCSEDKPRGIDAINFIRCKKLCKKRNDKTEEYKPWSSGYGRRLTIERPWFRILPQDTNRNLLVKIVPLLEKNENKLKTLSMAYLKFNKRFASFQIINYLMGNFAFTSF